VKTRDLDALMRANEAYHEMRVLNGLHTIIRVDGRNFSRYTRDEGYDKPFDAGFSAFMEGAAIKLMEEFDGVYAYTESDEISVLLPVDFDLFGRKVEKIVSISAAVASVYWSQATGDPVTFDSRVWIGTDAQVIDYFSWRQADAYRCALNGATYWALRNECEMTARAADRLMRSKSRSWKVDKLIELGIHFNDLPAWQRRGVALWWYEMTKLGYNPKMKVPTFATRRRVFVERDLPFGDIYRESIGAIMYNDSQRRAK
jgi:tRNA(His) guanylyltransferase